MVIEETIPHTGQTSYVFPFRLDARTSKKAIPPSPAKTAIDNHRRGGRGGTSVVAADNEWGSGLGRFEPT